MKNTCYWLLALWMLASCSSSGYRKTENGVIVSLNASDRGAARMVRVEVMGEQLMHVSATPEKVWSDAQSLVVVGQPDATPFTVGEEGDEVTLATARLTARIDRTTGRVCFCRPDGTEILREGFRQFVPIEVEGKQGYQVSQRFASVGDEEALYGLGQHQADEFNYKGKNEELFQYNTKVSVPFIVSNKGYGVLWDSYSLVRFGNPREYSQLGELFTLYDKEGKEGALTGTYCPADKGLQTLVRREPQIYFEHLDREARLNKVVNLPDGFPFMGATVTYEGDIEPRETGEYRFILYYAGYTKVYIDGHLVVPERWRTAWNPNSYKFTVALEQGKRVPLRIEWVPDGYVSYCGLRALSPVAEEVQQQMAWWSEMQQQEEYYFVAGENMDEVISGYRTLTGKAQVMPKWAMGYWQSRERYKTQEEIVSTMQEFRRHHFPIDNIVQDWSYWPEDAWGSHDFDAARFPDPKRMVDDIHALHGRVMISVWPKFYTSTEHYRQFDAQGWMYRQAVKDSIKDWIGPGYVGSFYDAYAEGARRLFWQQMQQKLYPLGFDAWWMDASEPNVRDCTDLQYRKDLCGPTALGPSAEYFNAYALMNAEAIYDGQRSADPDKRVFLLTRSGFAGLQRYSTATWSGDIATRWEDMKAQISAGLNFAVSGIPYWTMDIGGFCVESRYMEAQALYDRTGRENEDLKEWRELNARWFQFGAFCPLYRAHGQWPLREPWEIAPESHPAYKSILYYTQLRYRLMPYIYSLAGMTHFNDYTIMRPLVMDFTADAQVNDIGDQFLFGPALMAAPVYRYGDRTRTMYFPKGATWYDFYTGQPTEGGEQLTVAAPYERMPLYVRSGSILPLGPDMEWSDEKQPEVITLMVYAGADGAFTLYEDEGTNYNYEKGAYTMIPIRYDDAKGTVEIGQRQGKYPGMLQERIFQVVRITPEGRQAAQVTYNGQSTSVSL